MAPYESWTEFGQQLKHPESLVNFVAAYGRHPTILGATTLAAKRAAARAIVDPQPGDVPPADAADFMLGDGDWHLSHGETKTGIEDVDLWVGGLAEATNLIRRPARVDVQLRLREAARPTCRTATGSTT